MKIEKLSPSADRAGRYLVRFENGESLRLYRQTVEDFGLYAGAELDDEQYERLLSAAGEMSAKMRAVRIVSASNVSKRDLQQRLVRKGEAPDQAAAAVKWMADMDLLDDRKTAQQIASSCARKGYGIMRAKQALYEKKIPKQLWDEALSDYPDQSDAIRRYLIDHLPDDAQMRDTKRCIDALIRRGHSYGAIRRELGKLSVDTDQLPEE